MQEIAGNREPTQSANTMTSHRGRLVSTGTYLLLLCGHSILLKFIPSGLLEHHRRS